MRNLLIGAMLLALSSSGFALGIKKPVPQPVPQAPALKEWTFLIFLNGNNNLDSYGAKDINEMEKIGSTANLNVVVQWASYRAGDVKRLLVQKDNDSLNVTSPTIQNMGKVDMGNYKNLVDFVKWGVANYPAKRYFINVWNHGGGWHLQNLLALGFDGARMIDSGFSTNDISWDDFSGNFISTKQLGLALTESAQIIGHKVDIYGSDACLMAMPEVSTEMAAAVNYFVGSQETEPGPGWEYSSFLAKWTATAAPTAIEVSQALTDTYIASYQGGAQGTSSVTFSVFDLNYTAQFNQTIASFAKEIQNLNASDKAKVQAALYPTQSYAYSDYGDLVDFTSQINKSGISFKWDILTTIQNVSAKFVAYNKVTSAYANSHGVSIWLPTSKYTYDSYAARYEGLKFNQDTGWSAALKYLLY